MDPKMTISDAAAFLNISPQAVHKRIKSKGLILKRYQNRFYFGYDTAKELFNLAFSPKAFAIQNIKGGVGKTETAYCVSVCATLYGAKTIVIDLDSQANLTKNCFNINTKNKPIILDIIKNGVPVEEAIINIIPGLDLIPSDIDNGTLDNTLMLSQHPLDRVFKDIIDKLKQNYDLIMIDCPPALTASVTAAELAVDEVIAPVTPDPHAFSGLALLNSEIANIEKKFRRRIPLRTFLNKYDARNYLSSEYKDILFPDLKKNKDSKEFPVPVYKTYIGTSQHFPNAVDAGQSIFDTFKITPAKEDIHLLTREILGIEQQNINLKEWEV